ncbi:cyclopropane-fatty-acyl-phospholipid synthase [Chromatiales bacterium (ex Bugula neritina AB1)]|nr:cyclopropane-fatty-acyl-phospholipid synthase [Chromatiales bacterium (ex Bugula neritina AB1)]
MKKWVEALTPGSTADYQTLGSASERMARVLVHRHLGSMQRGELTLEEGGEINHFGGVAEATAGESETGPRPIVAHIKVVSPAAYTAIAVNGVVGAAEAFMDGHWTAPDLVSVVRFFVANMSALKGMDKERSLSNRLAFKVLDRCRRNSISRSRENISAHYDLGNDFFELFLDPTMMYSAALFDCRDISLEQASIAKLDLICRKLHLKPGDHLLEIGTGWGGMALHAAKNYGCRVTTTTLSQQQCAYTTRLVAEAGLNNKVNVLMKDYRELQGQFDKLVSIEMIEAVGHQYFGAYFGKCSSLLKPNGLMAIQAITIADQRYEQARRSIDFIQRYIFPGGCLPSMSVIANHVASDTDMCIHSVTDMTQDYATTLRLWREAFTQKIEQVRAQGFNERFINMWLYYLCYCEGGFTERVIGTSQIVMAKPDYRPDQNRSYCCQ